MNRNPAVFNAVLITAALATGLVTLFMILMTTGNVLGQFFKYLLVGLFAFGFLQPKQGVYTLIAICGYFDLFKRVLVVADHVSRTDMTYVLGGPPVLLGGVLFGLTVQLAKGKLIMRSWNWFCFAAIPVICTVAFFGGRMSGNNMSEVIGMSINAGFYSVLLFVIPSLFPGGAELRGLLRFTVGVYLPVAIYGVWQKFFGMTDFEIAYVKSGLTVTIDYLLTGEVRSFSTLNSPTALGAICSGLAALCFLERWQTPPSERRGLRGLILAFMGFIYVAGWVASTSRSDIAILLLGAPAALLFMSPRKTRALYVCCIAAFVTLVFSAEYLLNHLDKVQYLVWFVTGRDDTEFFRQMTRVGTYSDRLMGFSHLAGDARVWTLFGADSMIRETVHYHDPLTGLLLQVGVVPLCAGLAAGAYLILKIHRQIWRIEDLADRRLASTCLAVAFGMTAVSCLSGIRLNIFPVGMFFWLLLSVVATLGWNGLPQSIPQATDTTDAVKVPQPPQPAKGPGRFRPVPRPSPMSLS